MEREPEKELLTYDFHFFLTDDRVKFIILLKFNMQS